LWSFFGRKNKANICTNQTRSFHQKIEHLSTVARFFIQKECIDKTKLLNKKVPNPKGVKISKVSVHLQIRFKFQWQMEFIQFPFIYLFFESISHLQHPKAQPQVGTPPRQGHFVYPPLSSKPRTHVKHPLHTDRVILRLHRQAKEATFLNTIL
jgi:hypothetical protein